ncbi:MAG: Cytidylate kinase [Calditrichaeota bacterium]|nr:Cytidylate kinase [Calditrichota bacterium]
MTNLRRIITIDGPAGSGKSTTARLVAVQLGWQMIDTGAMYRAIGLAMLRDGIDPSDERAVCARIGAHALDLRPGSPPAVLLDGEDVSGAIRTNAAARASSEVAVHRCVRDKLVAAQRRIGSERPCVIEGRDTGTVVFPDAGLRIYLDAPVEQRAQRRLRDLGDNPGVTLAEMIAQVRERDRRDRTRAIGPLVKAPGAVVIDTGGLTVERQVARVLELARERFGGDR